MGLNTVKTDGTVVSQTTLNATGFTQATWLSGSLFINGVDIWYDTLNITATTGGGAENDAFIKAINHFTDQTGVTAGITADGKLTLRSADNSPIQIRTSTTYRDAASLGKLMEQNTGAADYNQNKASLGYFAGGASVGGSTS